MKKTTKGVLAAFAGGTLLLGGAGSLAFWTDTQDIPGSTINSGNLTLAAPDCGSGWELDNGDAFDPTADHLVPGDSITETCTASLTLVGNHIGATLTLDDPPTWGSSNGLTSELDPSVAWTIDGDPVAAITEAGTYSVEAEITVDFDGATATNGSKNLAAALNALTILATQDHVA